jgi:hypothetical protein
MAKKKASTSKKRPAKKPPAAQMLDLLTGYWNSQALRVFAQLGIADALEKKARTPAELARAADADPERLYRLLRALAPLGVVKEQRSGRFALAPLGRTLCAGAADSMRSFALMIVDDYNWNGWAQLGEGVRRPVLPFERVYGMEIFEYLDAHPEQLATFAASMSSLSSIENPAVAAAYDFGRVAHLVDVGGSHGHLLAEILRRYRRLRGTLYDRPPVIERARLAPYLSAKGVKDRVELVAGDFFAAVPAGADGYLMKYILHDWRDDLCVQILGHCRDAMEKRGRVLVVDTVIPPGNAPHWGKMLDLNMLALTGGRERTAAEFGELFRSAGLKLKKVHPTRCPLSIVEAVRA